MYPVVPLKVNPVLLVMSGVIVYVYGFTPFDNVTVGKLVVLLRAIDLVTNDGVAVNTGCGVTVIFTVAAADVPPKLLAV